MLRPVRPEQRAAPSHRTLSPFVAARVVVNGGAVVLQQSIWDRGSESVVLQPPKAIRLLVFSTAEGGAGLCTY